MTKTYEFGARCSVISGLYMTGNPVYSFTAGPRDGDYFPPESRVSGRVYLDDDLGAWVAETDRHLVRQASSRIKALRLVHAATFAPPYTPSWIGG